MSSTPDLFVRRGDQRLQNAVLREQAWREACRIHTECVHWAVIAGFILLGGGIGVHLAKRAQAYPPVDENSWLGWVIIAAFTLIPTLTYIYKSRARTRCRRHMRRRTYEALCERLDIRP